MFLLSLNQLIKRNSPLFSAGVCIALLFCWPAKLSAQHLPDLKPIKLSKNSQYKTAEPTVVQVIAFLLATPMDSAAKERRQGGEFLTRWMNGTQDHIFFLGDREASFFDTDADLLLVYMASLAKFTLENPTISDRQALCIGAMNIALPYFQKQTDKTHWNKYLWQLQDAYANGKLSEYLFKN